MNRSFPRSKAWGWAAYEGYQYTYKEFSCPGASTPCSLNWIETTNGSMTWDDTVSGGDTPNWRSRLRAHIPTTNALSGYRRQVTIKGGSVSADWNPDPLVCNSYCGYLVNGNHLGSPSFSTIYPGDDGTLNVAKRRFVQKAKAHLQPFAGGVYLGELRQTLRMIASPLKSLRKVLGDYGNALKKVPRKSSKASKRRALVDSYLEMTFGLLPLIGETQKGLAALAALQSSSEGEIIRLSSNFSKGDFSADAPLSVLRGRITVSYRQEHTVRRSTRITGAIRLRSKASGSVKDSLGFYPENFLPDMWELMPYSFVIDYFSNIGAIIDASSIVDSALVYACGTTRAENIDVIKSTGIQSLAVPELVKSSSHSSCSMTVKQVWVERYVVESLVPSLEFRLPNFGSKQALNVAALIYQSFLGVPRPFY